MGSNRPNVGHKFGNHRLRIVRLRSFNARAARTRDKLNLAFTRELRVARAVWNSAVISHHTAGAQRSTSCVRSISAVSGVHWTRTRPLRKTCTLHQSEDYAGPNGVCLIAYTCFRSLFLCVRRICAERMSWRTHKINNNMRVEYVGMCCFFFKIYI